MVRKLMILLTGVFVAITSVKASDVYMWNNFGQTVRLSPILFNLGQVQEAQRIANMYNKSKYPYTLQIKGKNAIVKVPVAFSYFFIDTPQDSIGSWQLFKLKQKKDRFLIYNKSQNFMNINLVADNEIKFNLGKVGDDLFQLVPVDPLKKGEYLLVQSIDGAPIRLYDFSVDSSAPQNMMPPDAQRLLTDIYETRAKNSLGNMATGGTGSSDRGLDGDLSKKIVRWYIDSDPRGCRVFYCVISNVPNEVKNTNESYMTSTPLEETKSINIPGLTYENSANVVIEVKLTKRGYEDQVKRYNVRQAIDQQEISGFFEMVPKDN